MKNKKMKLEDLKVQSFVTSMEKQQKQTIDGGTATPCSLAVISTIVASYNGCSALGKSIADSIPQPEVICATFLNYYCVCWEE